MTAATEKKKESAAKQKEAWERALRELPDPASSAELTLEETQRRVTMATRADVERRALILELYQGGMSQREIALRLTRASTAAGGAEVTENAVFKLLAKMRDRTPDEVRKDPY